MAASSLFELSFDPVAKTYLSARLIWTKSSSIFSDLLAGSTLPWIPAVNGAPAKFSNLASAQMI